VGINLMIGAFVPMIDNSAHLGGFLAGGLLAFGIPFVRPGETERPVFKVVQSALVLVIAASFFQVATHYAGPDLSLRNAVRGLSGGGGAPVGAFVAAINEGQEAFEFSEEVLDSGDLHRLPDVREDLGKAIDKMRDIPSLGDGPDQLAKELLDILQKQYDYVQEVERTGRPRSDFIGISPQSGRYRRLERRIEEWAETEGAHYGIVNTK
jgi:hypothetical protein